MLDELKKQFTSIQILITLLVIAVGLYLAQIAWQVLGNFSDVIVMLICAWLLSFILEPFVDSVVKTTRMNKIAAAFIVYLLLLALLGAIIFLFIPEVSGQIQSIIQILPRFLAPYPAFVSKAGDLISSSLGSSLLILPTIANIFLSIFLVLIISFYFVIDKENINKEFFTILPQKWHKDAIFIQEVIDSVFASFLRVQLAFGIISGIATWIVLTILGIPFAASTGLIAGILTMIPLLGPILGIIPPLLISFITDPTRALFVFAILMVIQQIVFNVVGPKMLGKAFKLHPVIVLLSFLVGFKVAGGAGAIFAVPVLGILIVVIHRLSRHFINPGSK